MGASTGRLGTVRMQHGLRASLESLEAHALLKPEVMIGDARLAFDDTGLTDEKAREIVARQLDAFATWIERVRIREAELG
jgi:chromate reductase, NAD(P)H dehydrogenase (quinone)